MTTMMPLAHPTHLAGFCVVSNEAALGCIALWAAVVCGGVLKWKGLAVDPSAQSSSSTTHAASKICRAKHASPHRGFGIAIAYGSQ
jgi:hypothetical protein